MRTSIRVSPTVYSVQGRDQSTMEITGAFDSDIIGLDLVTRDSRPVIASVVTSPHFKRIYCSPAWPNPVAREPALRPTPSGINL